MGYQESLIPITSLEEAARLKNALDTPDADIFFYCAARAKRDMHIDTSWVPALQNMSKEPFIRKGNLFIVVGGQRSLYPKEQRFIFIDSIAGLEANNYQDYFEDLPER